MKPNKHKTTRSTISLAFVIVGIILLGYSFGVGDTQTRTAFQSRLNEPLLRGSAVGSAQILPYLQRNRDIPAPILTASASLVWDSASSTSLWENNAHEQRPIASITKLMTATVVVDSADFAEEVTISERAVQAQGDTGNFVTGEKLNVATLLQAMLLESSNDAAVALSEHVEENTRLSFVSLMNGRAAAMGLTQSQFQDPAGLIDEDAHSTAHDLATLLNHLRIRPRYEALWSILSAAKLTAFSQDGSIVHTFENTNPFIEELGGIVGGKTGYTEGAGESMVLVVESPDKSRELFYIVLGSEDRFADMITLINWVGSAYIWEQKQ